MTRHFSSEAFLSLVIAQDLNIERAGLSAVFLDCRRFVGYSQDRTPCEFWKRGPWLGLLWTALEHEPTASGEREYG